MIYDRNDVFQEEVGLKNTKYISMCFLFRPTWIVLMFFYILQHTFSCFDLSF